MIVKNIYGATRSFGFANKVNVTLENNGEATLPDDYEVVADAYAKADAGYIQIVEGPASTKMISSGTAPDTLIIRLADNPSDEEIITIGDVVLEFDDDADIATDGAVGVTIGGSNIVTGANIVTAVNNSAALAALGVTATASGVTGASVPPAPVIVALNYAGTTAIADLTFTTDGADVTVAKKASAAGVTKRAFRTERTLTNTTTDLEFVTDLQSITTVTVSVMTATTGVLKAWDGDIRIVGNVVVLNVEGDADLAATDRVFLEAYGS